MLLAYLFITWAVKPEGMSLPGPASSGALKWWPGTGEVLAWPQKWRGVLKRQLQMWMERKMSY